MFCSNCGQKSNPDERFCSECGSSLERGEPEKKALSSGQSMKYLVGVVALVVIIAVIAGFSGSGTHSSPQSVVDAYYKAIQKNNYRQAVKFYDPEETKPLSSHEINEIVSFLSLAPIKSYRIGDTRYYGEESAAVEVFITSEYMGMRSEDKISERVVKRGGKWYISASLW